jgi:hypothetical protein
VLDAKGGENKGQSKKMDQLPLENFENNRIELLFCQNTLIGTLIGTFFCQKLASCGEKC